MERKSLYRYSEKKWSNALIERGSIRVGTLQDFRKTEHKPGISDPFEGTKRLLHEIDDWDLDDEVNGSPSYHAKATELMGMFSIGPNTGGIRFTGCSSERVVEVPNCFIYCTSHRLHKDVMSQFEGADSCVEIYRLQNFYECLTAAINKRVPVRWGGLRDVRYASRTEICNGNDFGETPTWLKGEDFAGQYEARAVWHPMNPHEPLEPFAMEIPELSRFCRKIKAR
ncbi:hypothetical protein [Pseudomonas violetae]|uniref:Uncharacterized protein n=1 Tax=Pseudomonas violetae TaxID=2915813 RepID=A0ABT0EV87_9PSED|nr:hypothetical protein [Pseudomonas violetae]MCK1789664.1 hypothetical protein [Pseudomonas violetae]